MIPAEEQGLEVSRQCRGEVGLIVQAFASALEDVNYHSEAALLLEWIESDEGKLYDFIVAKETEALRKKVIECWTTPFEIEGA